MDITKLKTIDVIYTEVGGEYDNPSTVLPVNTPEKPE